MKTPLRRCGRCHRPLKHDYGQRSYSNQFPKDGLTNVHFGCHPNTRILWQSKGVSVRPVRCAPMRMRQKNGKEIFDVDGDLSRELGKGVFETQHEALAAAISEQGAIARRAIERQGALIDWYNRLATREHTALFPELGSFFEWELARVNRRIELDRAYQAELIAKLAIEKENLFRASYEHGSRESDWPTPDTN